MEIQLCSLVGAGCTPRREAPHPLEGLCIFGGCMQGGVWGCEKAGECVSVCVCITCACSGVCPGDVSRAGRRHVSMPAAACVGTLHLLPVQLHHLLALCRARCCLLFLRSGTARLLGCRPSSFHPLNLFPSVCLSALLPVSSCLFPCSPIRPA